MQDPQARAELIARIRRVAHKVCRGSADFEDTVQDMILVILECQRADPFFAYQAPSYQVRRAMWRTQDKRRHSARDAVHFHLDTPLHDGAESPTSWYELIEGSGPADQEVIAGMTRADVRRAIASLRADPTDRRAILRYELIVRRFFGGQTVEQAAKALGIPKGTACTYSAQALKLLRGSLEGRI
jgi:RNA polymerase sigma factor (sigma-70 family)